MSQTLLHEIIRTSPRLGERTRARYLRDIDAWIDFAGPSPKDWTPYRAQAFYTAMLQRGLKAQSANRAMMSVRYAAKWWARREQNPQLNFAIVELAKARAREVPIALTPDAAERLLNTTHRGSMLDIRDRFMIVCGLETGMRRMSLASLAFERIDEGPGYPVARVKAKGLGEDLLEVALSDLTMHALGAWRDAVGKKRGPVLRRLERHVNSKNGHTDLRPVDGGISESMIYKIVAARAKEAGLSNVHPHVFRHTFVTWRNNQGLEPQEIASITGHDMRRALGALGGYMNVTEIAGRVRNETPPWLSDTIRRLEAR